MMPYRVEIAFEDSPDDEPFIAWARFDPIPCAGDVVRVASHRYTVLRREFICVTEPETVVRVIVARPPAVTSS